MRDREALEQVLAFLDEVTTRWPEQLRAALAEGAAPEQIIEIDNEGRVHFPDTCGECGAPVKYFTTGSSMPKPRYCAPAVEAPTERLYEIAEQVRKAGSLDNAVSYLRGVSGLGEPTPP